MRTKFFCTKFLNTPRGPGHPGKIPGTSQIPLFETQDKPPLRVEDPHPTGRSPDPKSLSLCSFFLPGPCPRPYCPYPDGPCPRSTDATREGTCPPKDLDTEGVCDPPPIQGTPLRRRNINIYSGAELKVTHLR